MKKILLHLALMALALVGLCALASLWLGIWTRHGHTIEVPAVRSLPCASAMSLLESEGLRAVVSDSVYGTHGRPGTVIDQNPKAGTVVKDGREVFLTITAFSPKMVTLPSLCDISLRQARSILEGLDISRVRETRVPSEYQDLVLAVRYKGRRVLPGARVPVDAEIELEVGEAPTETLPADSLETSDSQIDLF